MMISKICFSLSYMILVLFSNLNEFLVFFTCIFKRTTFQCGNQNNRTPHNLSSADFPRVRIKIFSVCQKSVPCKKWWCWFEMWKSEWKCVIKVVVASCDSFFNACIVGSVDAILRIIYIQPGKIEKVSSRGARCEKSGWVKLVKCSLIISV